MSENAFRGRIYAVDDRHQSIDLEAADGTRMIVQPEVWAFDTMKQWLDARRIVFATGMKAAGLPVLMRADVKVSEEDGYDA